MGKRVLLFLVTNLAIMVVLSIVLSLLGFGGYLGTDGQLLIGPLMVFCLVWGMGGALISLMISRMVAKWVMGIKLVNGQTGNEQLDWFHSTVENLARQANLPMPQVGYYESEDVNAFATGPSKKRSLVAVSTGLLRTMKREEAAAVLGHELGHIANGDMVTMTLIQGVVNAFVMFFARIIAFAVRQVVHEKIAWMVSFAVRIVMEIVLGILGMLVTSWFSRQREFRADAAGAALAGRENMVAALERLRTTVERVDTAHPSLAAMKISGRKGWLHAFSTHPPLEVRIEALRAGR